MSHSPPQFWIDVGGTFTDCFLRTSDGRLLRHKLLSSGVTRGVVGDGSTEWTIRDGARSSDPPRFWNGYSLQLLDGHGEVVERRQVAAFDARATGLHLSGPLKASPPLGQRYELVADEEAPLVAIRYLLGLRRDESFPRLSVRLGTTRGTNALLTRHGAKAAFVTTRGFGDLPQIGNQNRPKLFELNIRKPPLLCAETLEIDERVSATGEILRSPNEQLVRQQLRRLRESGVDSLAICLLHALRNDVHERWLATLALELGFADVSLSSRVAPIMKIVSRADTTAVDAYLTPVLREYVAALRRSLGKNELRVLTSAGGLVSAERFSGKDSILSGPAGGVVGFSRVAEAAGFPRAIGFDMGGTSTDVSRYDGRYQLEFETEKAGVRIVAPMLKIETVAAGGGSVCHFDGVKLAVGPSSAGADPGPACYGRGGPLTVTDLNVFLGRIPVSRFPFPLDKTAIERRLSQLLEEVAGATGVGYQPVELAEGLLRIANANMAAAIRSISLAEGVDQREYVLVAFGGAAPQHACAVATELGIKQILNHPDSGILSAYGIGLAEVARHGSASVYRPYDPETLAGLEKVFAQLQQDVRGELEREGVSDQRMSYRRSLDLRYQGVEASICIDEPADGDYARAFAVAHESLYGYTHPRKPLEIVIARVEGVGRGEQRLPDSRRVAPEDANAEGASGAAVDLLRCWFAGEEHSTPLYDRSLLLPGDRIVGPAVIAEPLSTTVIDPGWQAESLTGGELLMEAVADSSTSTSTHIFDEAKLQPAADLPADPILLEIFNNHFASIARQMGITLQHTASSVNVKERLDFSCAIFTSTGDLVVNAPHIPVHLGAMSETVRGILTDNPKIAPGDVFATNDPYRGGSHLPDVTVVTPVHDATSGELLFLTASRAHHAEIGGKRPGSIPPDSRNLAEEGVLIQNFKLISAGESHEEELADVLRSGPYPSRNVADNLADLRAQVAANRQGARDLLALVAQRGRTMVLAYMRHIQDAASAKTRRALAALPDGAREFVDHLDDGSPIAVKITIAGDRATIDFTGTGPVLKSNLNANRAIVSAAVMYCMRLLINEEIPLNQGVLEPLELILPECLLNPTPGQTPSESPAVVGGNTETSQRVVDVLLGALGLAAASQGTMNNLTFGDATFGYYETICGGAGASAASKGASAVHTHMTNTRLTDPEVIETRFPVRLREFSLRRESGGAGRHRGGDGVVRQIEFLRSMDVSLLTERRGPFPPYGFAGGEPGQLGRNTLIQSDGRQLDLGGRAQFTALPGDVLKIETPGGGGWGSPRT